MEVNDELVDKVSKLAMLKFENEERTAIKEDMTKILAFVEKLNEIDTSNVEEMLYVNDEVNILRDDKVESQYTKDDALKNAPNADSDFIKVPKVLNKK